MPSGVAWTTASKWRAVHLLARQRLGAAHLASARTRSGLRPTSAILAPASASAQAAPRAAPPLPTISTVAFGSRSSLRKRPGDAGGVGIGAAPFAGLAPHRIHGADAPRQRIHHIQIAHDLLLVRNGDAEAGERQIVGQLKEIAQMRRRSPGTADRPRRSAAIETRGCERPAKCEWRTGSAITP